jgi:hypothetical protein
MNPPGSFRQHGISDAFLDHLAWLAHADAGSWWRDVLLRDDVFIAVRRNSLNVYYRGASLFRIDDKGDGTASPKTHVKYLARQQQILSELVEGTFVPNPVGWANYQSPDTLRDMIRAASDLAGFEKAGLHLRRTLACQFASDVVLIFRFFGLKMITFSEELGELATVGETETPTELLSS